MENEEIAKEAKKPKRTSLILCTIVQTIGWILLIQTTIFFIMILTGQHKAIEDKQPAEIIITLIAYWFAMDFFILGASVIILGQLARFIIGQISRPGIMLRWGGEILLVFSFATVLWARCLYQSLKPLLPNEIVLPVLVIFTVAVAIKVSVLILLSQILKRVMPVIEESKTLV